MNKCNITTLTILLAALVLFSHPSYAADVPTLRFDSQELQIEINQQRTVSIIADTAGQQVLAIGAEFSYDPQKIKIESVTPGSLFDDHLPTSDIFNNQTGTFALSGINYSANKTFNGQDTFATITFTVLETAPTSLEFNFNQNDPTNTTDANMVSTTGDILGAVQNLNINTQNEQTNDVNAQLFFSHDNVTLNVGQSSSVQLLFDTDGQPIIAAGADLIFDPQYIRVNSYEPAPNTSPVFDSYLPPSESAINNQLGTVEFSGIYNSANKSITGTHTFATITFEALQPGTTTISYRYNNPGDTTDSNLVNTSGDILQKISPINITIANATPTPEIGGPAPTNIKQSLTNYGTSQNDTNGDQTTNTLDILSFL